MCVVQLCSLGKVSKKHKEILFGKNCAFARCYRSFYGRKSSRLSIHNFFFFHSSFFHIFLRMNTSIIQFANVIFKRSQSASMFSLFSVPFSIRHFPFKICKTLVLFPLFVDFSPSIISMSASFEKAQVPLSSLEFYGFK